MTSRSNDVVRYFKGTKHRVAPRVYWFILSSHRETQPLETTLEEIATMVNTNRHSVSRALRLLRGMGVISYRRDKYGLLVEHVSDLL